VAGAIDHRSLLPEKTGGRTSGKVFAMDPYSFAHIRRQPGRRADEHRHLVAGSERLGQDVPAK